MTGARSKTSIRHYWNSHKMLCDCGCKDRFFICGHWVCVIRIKEEMEQQGLLHYFKE